jgi:uncharacterized protein (TIGR02145 family)
MKIVSGGGKIKIGVAGMGNLNVGNYFIDPRDGTRYKTVQIGNQIWMAENLKYLPSVSPSNVGSGTDPYYYVYGYQGTDILAAKATDNYKTYGVLYNWSAALTACPSGWHLPSDTEYKILEMYLGMTQAQADATGWRGTDEGSKLSTFTLNGNNSSGFTALMSGYRHTDGSFSSMGSTTIFWSSTGSGSSAWHRYLYASFSTVNRNTYSKALGFSVRCIRDY